MAADVVETPLQGIDCSFRHYIERRKLAASAHLDGNGLPDYAFSEDYALRKKLDSIPQFYQVCKKVCATYASRQLQIVNQSALAVGPGQFPDVYEIAKDCAKRLGIGIPNVYIFGSGEINAYTIATDDIEPLIVINSALYERFSPGELRTVIGHECGHIHNQHGVYHIIAQILLQGGVSALSTSGVSSLMLSPILIGAQIALNAWSRAEEITCDRAGMICCERIEDARTAEAKFLYGAAFGEHKVNFEELKKQLDMQQGNLTRLEELGSTHPVPVRRIIAEELFAECELFYRWRPDLRIPGQMLRSKEATDELCKHYVNVFRN